MEEQNSNQTINLAGMTGSGPIPNVQPLVATLQTPNVQVNNVTPQEQVNLQAQAQVVQTSTTAPIVNNTVNIQQPVSDLQVTKDEPVNQPAQPATTTETLEVKAENTPHEFVMRDKYIVNLDIFKDMISNARKAALCDSLLEATNIFDITFDNEYLKVVATDNTNTLVQINTDFGYKTPLHINIGAGLFEQLISKLDCNTIEIIPEDQGKLIKLITDDGSTFTMSSILSNEGVSVSLEKQEGTPLGTDKVFEIDLAEFKQLIARAFTLSADPSLYASLSGVFCQDKIYGTNSNNVIIMPNLPQLVNESFLLTRKFVELFLKLNFKNTGKLYLRYENNDVSYIIIDDGTMKLYGKADLESLPDFPIESLRPLANSSFNCNFSINKDRLLKILERAALFISPNSDKECCRYICDSVTSSLNVNSVNNQSKQIIPVTGLNVTTKEFHLKVKDAIKVLQNCVSDQLIMQVNTDDYRSVKFVDNTIIQVMAVQTI